MNSASNSNLVQINQSGRARNRVLTERHDVSGFFNYGKLEKKIPLLGLLMSSKLFFLHNNNP